jgi:hypothetical protein
MKVLGFLIYSNIFDSYLVFYDNLNGKTLNGDGTLFFSSMEHVFRSYSP